MGNGGEEGNQPGGSQRQEEPGEEPASAEQSVIHGVTSGDGSGGVRRKEVTGRQRRARRGACREEVNIDTT